MCVRPKGAPTHVSTMDFEKYFWEKKGMPLYFLKKKNRRERRREDKKLTSPHFSKKNPGSKKNERSFLVIDLQVAYRIIRHII